MTSDPHPSRTRSNNELELAMDEDSPRSRFDGLFCLLETCLIVILFFLFSPAGIPGVNEPHYLCKAKHFWDPTFCEGDIFLESADAHYLFYFSLGLLTQNEESLSNAAVAGRFICWAAIAWGWQFLCLSVLGRRFWSVLAAGLFLLGLHYCHLAGEWLIGGVEAKCLAYAFVFAGLGHMVRKNWLAVWPLFGLGAAFHVLVGGWAVLVALPVWICSGGWRFRLKPQVLCAILGFGISLAGLVPALMLTVGQDASIVAEANEIYTFERIAHHLVFSHIVESHPARLDLFLFALFAWTLVIWVCWPCRRIRPLHGFVLGTLLVASVALVIEYYSVRTQNYELAARFLRYYWFRLSDIFVPVGLGIGLTLASKHLYRLKPQAGAIVIAVLCCAVGTHVTLNKLDYLIKKRSQADDLTLPSFGDESLELNKKIMRDWIEVCVWIRNHTESDSRFITPRAQSTFKWYAHRSEVVSWKDVPQDAVGIVNWHQRFNHVFGPDTFRFGLATHNAEERLIALSREYDAQYLVIERRHVRARKADLEYRFQYRQFLLGQKPGPTPFDKPLCLKQVYPNSSCPENVRKDSAYLVYRTEIPPAYEDQLVALEEMLNWYRTYEEWVAQQLENEQIEN